MARGLTPVYKVRMKIAVFPGDGIGPEIVRATTEVLATLSQAYSLGLEFETRAIGLEALENYGTTCPAEIVQLARDSHGVLLGPISHAKYPLREAGGINVSAELRIQLDLFANIRPSRSRQQLPFWGRTPMDLVIVRENTEGFYADRNMFCGNGEFMPTEDVALAIRKVTARGSRRIARAGCELAMQRRKRVTVVHKANVLKISEGLFLKEVREVAAQFDLEYEEQLVDSMAALLIRKPDHFDVVITTNMFGDILSDQAAELSGGLGLAGSINVGERHCMAQAAHGSAPDIAGLDLANPTSLLLSAAMMLQWLGHRHQRVDLAAAATALEQALDSQLAQPETRTPDLGGALGTREFARQLQSGLRGS